MKSMNLVACSILLAMTSLGTAQQSKKSNGAATTTTSSEADADGQTRPSKTFGYDEAYMPRLFPSSHAVNLINLNNGDLFATWFSGTKEGASDVAIVCSRLPHGSNQWTKPSVVDHQAGKSFQNPVPFESEDGRLWVFHTEQDANAGQSNANVLYVTSVDHGKTWTEPKTLFDKPGAFDRQPLVTVSKEKWILPMYYTPSRGITKGAESNYSVVEITSDAGKTWKECEIPQSSGLVQPSVIKDGSHYIAFFRSRFADWIYKSTSNEGCTWTPPAKTELPNNNASIQAVRLRNGHIAIAFNNTSASTEKGKPKAGPRVPLSVAVSEDNAKTWRWVRDIETGDTDSTKKFSGLSDDPGREEYSYPSIVQRPDGKISVAYTFRRETIKIVSFDERWIRNGTTTGKFKPH